MADKVGFIGLGAMGGPMALNLAKAGHKLVVHDIDQSKTAAVRAQGAELAGNAEAVAAAVDRTILIVETTDQAQSVIVGERGIITYRAPNPEVRSFFTVDTFADRVVDAVGAGDALLSYATLSMVATRTNVIGTILGALAAAVACENDGNLPVAPEAVLKKINLLEKRSHFE